MRGLFEQMFKIQENVFRDDNNDNRTGESLIYIEYIQIIKDLIIFKENK